MYILIDGGGTSSKGYVTDLKTMIHVDTFGQGNIVANYNDALHNYCDYLKAEVEKYGEVHAVIFAAGYLQAPAELKKELKETIVKSSGVASLQIYGDSELPLFSTTKKAAALTFGTGTALGHNTNGKSEVLLGYGHILKDPVSGYSLAKQVLYFVLLKGTEEEKKKILGYYGTDSLSGLINIVYKNQTDKRIISDPFEKIYKDKMFAQYIDKAMNNDIEELMDSPIKDVLKKAEVIILNGSIANLPEVKNKLEKYVGSKEYISTNDRKALMLTIAQNFKW